MLLNYCTCWGESVFLTKLVLMCYSILHLQQRDWYNDEINAHIERIEADFSGVEEDERLLIRVFCS